MGNIEEFDKVILFTKNFSFENKGEDLNEIKNNVISADYDKLVQKTPGTIIKFKLVDLPVAEKAFQDYVRKF